MDNNQPLRYAAEKNVWIGSEQDNARQFFSVKRSSWSLPTLWVSVLLTSFDHFRHARWSLGVAKIINVQFNQKLKFCYWLLTLMTIPFVRKIIIIIKKKLFNNYFPLNFFSGQELINNFFITVEPLMSHGLFCWCFSYLSGPWMW